MKGAFMSTKTTLSSNAVFLLKDLLFSYLLTGLFLLLTAFCLYRLSLSDKTISLIITCIYVIVTFLCGFIAGKKTGTRKFLWGAASGLLYFSVLLMLSFLFKQEASSMGGNPVSVLVLCTASGMLGGMVS